LSPPDDEAPEGYRLPHLFELKALAGDIAWAAQVCYDEWDQDANGEDLEHGTGGICHVIADATVSVLQRAIPGMLAVSNSLPSVTHVNVLVAVREGVVALDVPHAIYERGDANVWHKIPGVHFEPEDVTFDILHRDPSRIVEFWDEGEGDAVFEREPEDEPPSVVPALRHAR
jgi:hypothetical protein